MYIQFADLIKERSSFLDEEKERRYQERIHFQNGKVYCEEKSAFGFIKQYSDSGKLNDITKSGVSFDTHKHITRGDIVQLKIDIPGEKNIQVKGQVMWVSHDEHETNHTIGVQFLPFGSMKQYNSFNTRERLEKLVGKSSTNNKDLQ